jgi:hypothetical protein
MTYGCPRPDNQTKAILECPNGEEMVKKSPCNFLRGLLVCQQEKGKNGLLCWVYSWVRRFLGKKTGGRFII